MSGNLERGLAINLARVTEAAALGAAIHFGRGDKNLADGAAVEKMRNMFDKLDINGVIVIGEGERDKAPMLYIGEEVGLRREDSPKVDIAVDPIDGTIATANGMNNALAILAIAPRGCLLHAPDMYMEKIAVGPRCKGKINLDNSIEENLEIMCRALNKDIEDITVALLERDRHSKTIKEIRAAGARVRLYPDGDVAPAIATCFGDSGIDMMLGSGGAPEGVITAAALKGLGGEFQGRLLPKDSAEEKRCSIMGIDDCNTKLEMDQLVKGDEVFFSATGISDGELLRGVRFMDRNTVKTHTMVTRGITGTTRFIEAVHRLDKKPDYAY